MLVVVVVAVFNVHQVEQAFISHGYLHPGVWEEITSGTKWGHFLYLFTASDV